MKKLMIALVAAAAVFGLRADDAGFISGSDFEIEALDTTLWTAADGAATLTEGAHTVLSNKRPEQWKFSNNATNLAIKTTLGSPVTQKIKASGSQLIDTGVYFDGLVNLTVFDVEDTPPAADLEDAKLGVYLQLAKEDESETNLVVVAQGATGAKNYVCYGADLTPGWHRLTIKAIANIYNEDAAAACAGFVVFVDNTPVGVELKEREGIVAADLTPNAKKFYDVGQLFASLGGDDASLTSISYDGQGVIDEVAFTTVAPFDAAKDTDFVQVTWTAANVITMTIGGEEYTGGTAYAPITYSGDPKVALPITVTWVGAGDYVNGNYTITTPSAETPVELDSQMKLAAAILGDAKFETIAAAVVEANKAASGTLVIKNVADGDEDVELNNANVALDLNGQTVGEVGVEGGAAITLTNTDTENDAVVEGTVYPAITVDVKTIKFSIENNSDLEGNPDIDADFGANNWELAAEQADPAKYWVIQEKQDIVIDVPTAAVGLTYTGEEQTGVAEGDGYTLTDNVKIDAGNYTATATLKAGYVWSDKSKETKQIAWSIAAKAVTPAITFDPADEEVTWVEGGAFPQVSVVAEGESGTDYTEGWADGAVYPAVNPEEAVTFTYTVTMQGNYTGTTSKTLKINPAAKPVDPVIPGTAIDVPKDKTQDEFLDDVNKDKATYLKAPYGETTSQDYLDCFTAVADGADKVKFELNEAGQTKLEEIAENTIATFAADSTTLTVEDPIEGFYYSLKESTALESLDFGAQINKQANAASFTLSKEDDAGFWQVVITEAAVEVDKQ